MEETIPLKFMVSKCGISWLPRADFQVKHDKPHGKGWVVVRKYQLPSLKPANTPFQSDGLEGDSISGHFWPSLTN